MRIGETKLRSPDPVLGWPYCMSAMNTIWDSLEPWRAPLIEELSDEG